MLRALQWLIANNKYHSNNRINPDALVMLPEDGDLSGLYFVTLDSTEEDSGSPSAQDEDVDPYNTHLSGYFVPTEQETVRQFVQQGQRQRALATVSRPPSGSAPFYEFNTEVT